MAQERKQLNWRWAWLGAAIILLLVFMSVRSLTRERLEVRAVQAAHRALESTISTNGRVEPETPYQIPSPLATTVKAVYVQPGDQVQAGKLLMVLDDLQARARLASAESGVKSAQAIAEAATHNGTREQQQAAAADLARQRLDRDQAQHDLDALTKLNATGAASASEVAAARQRLANANAALEASQTSSQGRYSPAEVERAQAALADAEANLAAARQVEDETKVHAPAAGTVYSIDAKPTEFVEQGKVLLQLADLHRERVRAYFDEPEIGNLAVGQQIQIKWDAKPNRSWRGHIERVPVTVIHLDTRTVGEVLVAIDDVDGELLPDTNVTVTVTTSSEPNALSIPREALHMENGKPYVFRIIKDELKRTPVVTGTLNLTQVAILSGLNEGDWVATGSTSGQPLQEGVPIKELR
ncbi:MAG TPA: efflux RND transporter periplasmic adaptor subunit [Terracidiphilus sp.]|jgi:HlyD family secretion protein